MWNKYTGDLNLSCLTSSLFWFQVHLHQTRFSWKLSALYSVLCQSCGLEQHSLLSQHDLSVKAAGLTTSLLRTVPASLRRSNTDVCPGESSLYVRAKGWRPGSGWDSSGVCSKHDFGSWRGFSTIVQTFGRCFSPFPQQNVFLRTLLSLHGRIPKGPQVQNGNSPCWIS